MKHIHMIGIGGSAMAPLAGMLRERGYKVTGSDAGVYPPASTLLDSLGIPFAGTFDAKHLTPTPDLIVVGNAVSRGNVEVEEMLDRKLPHRSLPEILEEEFLPGKHSIVVPAPTARPPPRPCSLGSSTQLASIRISLSGAWPRISAGATASGAASI
jgi:UDP-N-acetylmuramate-alanine ligase